MTFLGRGTVEFLKAGRPVVMLREKPFSSLPLAFPCPALQREEKWSVLEEKDAPSFSQIVSGQADV